MRISAIIPVYNGARFLADAVSSVQGQTRPADEVIIVDDGSTDETPAVIAGFGAAVRALRQENAGPAAARNAGLREATGDAIAFLDHDDLWPAERLALMADAFAADPAADIVCGMVEVRDLGSGSINEARHPTLLCMPWSFPALLIRRQAFETVGELNVRQRHAEDVDWYCRARDCGLRYVMIPEVSLIHRRHGSNMTRAVEEMQQEFLRAMKLKLDRRRGSH